MKFLTRRKMTDGGWDEALANYREYRRSVADLIPSSFVELERIRLHDLKLNRVSWCGPGILDVFVGWYHLIFSGVQHADIDSRSLGETWLYDELHPGRDALIELHAMLDEFDLLIVSRDVSIYTKAKGWIVGADPGLVVPPDRV